MKIKINIEKVVNELKKTNYKVNTMIQSSRDNLCINPVVQKVGLGMRRVQRCATAVKKNQCKFYCKANDIKILNNCEPLLKSPFVYDIEDAVSIGHKFNLCPYYMTKNMEEKLDLTLLPYNYLINNGINDNNIKSTQDIINNNIIIFDEAHNIEKFCEEALSTEIAIKDILKCKDEIKFVLNTKYDINLEYEGIIQLEKIIDLLNTNIKLIKLENKTLIENFEYFYKNILYPSGIQIETYNSILNQIDLCVLYLINYNIKDHIEAFSLHKLKNFIQTIFYAISYILNHQNNKLKEYQFIKNNQISNYYSKLNENFHICLESNNESNINLQFWCFAPKIAMFIFEKAFCVIVTSGTLSPFDIFLKEIGLSFPIQLENAYLLNDKNLSVNIVTKSINNESNFLFTYNNRENIKMITQLGKSIVNLSEIIPDGILIFLPSYTLLETILKHWKKDGIYKILSERKKLVFELKDKDLKNIVQQHHDNIKNQKNNSNQIIKCNGSILFGVFRGKISEGINFSDEACRAVIIIGIPYPPHNDPKITLKRNLLEHQQVNDGKIWYQHQALRAVNQAIGRVIRHRNDFGMVFLFDERFLFDSNRKCFPLWVQKHVYTHKNFGTVIKEAISFFKIHGFTNNVNNIEINRQENFHMDNDSNKIMVQQNTQTNVFKNQSNAEKWNYNYLVSDKSQINSAMKRLKQVQDDAQKKQLFLNSKNSNNNSCLNLNSSSSSSSLRVLLNSRSNLNTKLNIYSQDTVENKSIKLNPYEKNVSKDKNTENLLNFEYTLNLEQEKKLRLFKLVIDNSVCEKFKNLCIKYYKDKNISKFMDESKSLLPSDLIPQLGTFILSEHDSIYKIYISSL